MFPLALPTGQSFLCIQKNIYYYIYIYYYIHLLKQNAWIPNHESNWLLMWHHHDITFGIDLKCLDNGCMDCHESSHTFMSPSKWIVVTLRICNFSISGHHQDKIFICPILWLYISAKLMAFPCIGLRLIRKCLYSYIFNQDGEHIHAKHQHVSIVPLAFQITTMPK